MTYRHTHRGSFFLSRGFNFPAAVFIFPAQRPTRHSEVHFSLSRGFNFPAAAFIFSRTRYNMDRGFHFFPHGRHNWSLFYFFLHSFNDRGRLHSRTSFLEGFQLSLPSRFSVFPATQHNTIILRTPTSSRASATNGAHHYGATPPRGERRWPTAAERKRVLNRAGGSNTSTLTTLSTEERHRPCWAWFPQFFRRNGTDPVGPSSHNFFGKAAQTLTGLVPTIFSDNQHEQREGASSFKEG